MFKNGTPCQYRGSCVGFLKIKPIALTERFWVIFRKTGRSFDINQTLLCHSSYQCVIKKTSQKTYITLQQKLYFMLLFMSGVSTQASIIMNIDEWGL